METLRVLVCDDEMGMRMGVSRALRDFRVDIPEVAGEVNFEVVEAETGEQAIDIIAAQAPHVLLLDHKLPGMSGLDVLDAIVTQPLDMMTVIGPVSFNADGTGNVLNPLVQWINGKMELVWPLDQQTADFVYPIP